jgi:hypothetical protein
MTLRAFTDAAGVRWEVWEAHPLLVERRTVEDRRAVRRSGERRIQLSPQRTAADAASDGWLVFHSANERRRERPIPSGWEKLSDEGMRSLMAHARPSGPRSRIAE